MVGLLFTSKWIFSISCVGEVCVLRMRSGSLLRYLLALGSAFASFV